MYIHDYVYSNQYCSKKKKSFLLLPFCYFILTEADIGENIPHASLCKHFNEELHKSKVWISNKVQGITVYRTDEFTPCKNMPFINTLKEPCFTKVRQQDSKALCRPGTKILTVTRSKARCECAKCILRDRIWRGFQINEMYKVYGSN